MDLPHLSLTSAPAQMNISCTYILTRTQGNYAFLCESAMLGTYQFINRSIDQLINL